MAHLKYLEQFSGTTYQNCNHFHSTSKSDNKFIHIPTLPLTHILIIYLTNLLLSSSFISLI